MNMNSEKPQIKDANTTSVLFVITVGLGLENQGTGRILEKDFGFDKQGTGGNVIEEHGNGGETG